MLKQLKVGRKATLPSTRPSPAATPWPPSPGTGRSSSNGVRTVINDRLLHPRTAVGIDTDGHKLFFLVIDGRSAYSRGYTMVELANMMIALGADDALNLDGGGSSTLYSRKVTGEMGVINEPSDGTERKVANGLGIFYDGVFPPIAPPIHPGPGADHAADHAAGPVTVGRSSVAPG